MTTQAGLDTELRIALEEERDHLLASLDDLEAEYAAGDMDEGDYRSLKEDYTARAAEVLRRLEGSVAPRPAATSRRPAPREVAPRRRDPRRGAMVLLGIVAFAALAGWGMASAVGQRGAGTLTGNDDSLAERLATCIPLVRQDPANAVPCLDEVLAKAPDNVQALTFSGRALASTGRPEEALVRLDRAIEVDPTFPNALVFRASVRADQEDFDGALADLGAFYETRPSRDDAALITQTGLNRRVLLGVVPEEVAPCWQGLFDATEGQTFEAGPLGAFVGCLDGVLAGDPDNATALAHRAYGRIALLDVESVGPEADAAERDALADVNAAVRLAPTDPDVILLAAFVAAPVQPELAIAGLDRLDRDGVRPPISLIDLDPAAVRSFAERLLAQRDASDGASPGATPTTTTGG